MSTRKGLVGAFARKRAKRKNVTRALFIVTKISESTYGRNQRRFVIMRNVISSSYKWERTETFFKNFEIIEDYDLPELLREKLTE